MCSCAVFLWVKKHLNKTKSAEKYGKERENMKKEKILRVYPQLNTTYISSDINLVLIVGNFFKIAAKL